MIVIDNVTVDKCASVSCATCRLGITGKIEYSTLLCFFEYYVIRRHHSCGKFPLNSTLFARFDTLCKYVLLIVNNTTCRLGKQNRKEGHAIQQILC